jgi:sulfur carrier protein ThiS adenylyltransferase
MNKTEALKDNLFEIAPYAAIETHKVRISENNAEKLLKKADVICEAFDDAESKAMLANLVLEKMPEKYLVASSGMAGLDSANTIQTRRISKRFYICGDGISDVQSEGSLIASRVMICAAHQAHTVLRILTEQFEA